MSFLILVLLPPNYNVFQVENFIPQAIVTVSNTINYIIFQFCKDIFLAYYIFCTIIVLVYHFTNIINSKAATN